jgi:hypothetical protein
MRIIFSDESSFISQDDSQMPFWFSQNEKKILFEKEKKKIC